MEKQNKLSLDLHGVINDLPEVFKSITKSLINDGWEVHIITGSITQKAYSELIQLGLMQGVHFTHVVGLPDYCLMKGVLVTGINEKHGNVEFPSNEWFKMKALYCSENKIDLHMDDQLEYGNSFVNTAFARLFTKNKETINYKLFEEFYGKTVEINGKTLVWTKSEADRNKGLYTPFLAI